MTQPPADMPPLPHLSISASETGTMPQNEWRLLLESVPVHAERSRYFRRKGGVFAIRSPFRVGKIEFTPDGFRFEGMATNPVAWLKVVGGFALFSSWILQMVATITRRFNTLTGIYLWIWSFLPLFGAAIYLIANFINERRRIPATLFLPWINLQDLQMDKGGKFLTLVYNSQSTPAPGIHYLTLNNLNPMTAAGIVATIEHFAPEACRHRFIAQQEERMRLLGVVIVTTLIAIVCACVVLLNP